MPLICTRTRGNGRIDARLLVQKRDRIAVKQRHIVRRVGVQPLQGVCGLAGGKGRMVVEEEKEGEEEEEDEEDEEDEKKIKTWKYGGRISWMHEWTIFCEIHMKMSFV